LRRISAGYRWADGRVVISAFLPAAGAVGLDGQAVIPTPAAAELAPTQLWNQTPVLSAGEAVA
jgi:hypothetical protein